MAPSTAVLRGEIRAALVTAGLSKVDDDTLSKCVGMAASLHVSAKQMAECWEAFSMSRHFTKLDNNCFDAFKKQLVKEADQWNLPEPMDTTSSSSGAILSRPSPKASSNDNKNNRLPSVTPPANKRLVKDGQQNMDTSSSKTRRISLSPSPPTRKDATNDNNSNGNNAPKPKYNERTGAGKVMQTYNPNNLEAMEIDDETTTTLSNSNSRNGPKCHITYDCFDTNMCQSYRHMNTPLEERAMALDQHLVELGQVMVERYGIGQEDENTETGIASLEAVGVARQEKVCCIGRICNAAHEGRLNATSILLEGSRHSSNGARVELDLSHLKASQSPFSLFSGQVVAVEGINTTGRKLVAHRISEGAAHEPAQSTVQELQRFHHDDDLQAGLPLKVMAVCGPFTTSDNLDYEALLDLLNIVTMEKTDVVILSGPFVDMRHPSVRSGQTTLQFQDGEEVLVSYEVFFANKIAALLEELFQAEKNVFTQFVLVPSLDDATAEWVYPQPPLSDRIPGGAVIDLPGAEEIEIGTLGLNHVETANRTKKGFRRVHCVSNPCTFKINELVVGITSTDVLFHTSCDETNANLEAGARLGRISQHMLQQRSYYPLFPPAEGANLDLKHMDKWKMPCQPDLLIIPSKLNTFAKNVLDKTVVVNPGHLTRATTGGTYAMMEIHPLARKVLEEAGGQDVKLQHGLSDRIRIEIKRI